MAPKIEVGGWYKWEVKDSKQRRTKFHLLVRAKGPWSSWIGWTACGLKIPKSERCRVFVGPVYGGEEKPCKNCTHLSRHYSV